MSFQECLRSIDESVCRVLLMPPANAELAQWMRGYADNHRRRLAEDLHLIRTSASKGSAILEFGSSPFFLTDALNRAGYRLVGLDIDPARFSETIARCALDVRSLNFETQPVPFDDESIDVVLFNEVFEHLRIDLIATMREVCRVLKPGGTLWLSTPNHRSLVGLWTLLWHNRGCHVCPYLFDEYEKLTLYGHMGHVREYTVRDVSDFLARVGLRTRRIRYRNSCPRKRGSVGRAALDKLARSLTAVLPALRPLFTLECERPATSTLRNGPSFS